MAQPREQALRLIAAVIRVICGVHPLGRGAVQHGPKVYYANHTSHLDFTLIWSVLPHGERMQTRPVAGRDYWTKNRVARFFGCGVFNSLLIERKNVTRKNNPVEQMKAVLEEGTSLIVFPEGTRHHGKEPGNFKSGLYHLAQSCPDVPLIPVYLENLNRMMPKGTFIPVPLITRISFGDPLVLGPELGEKEAFLNHARESLINLNS